MHVWVTHPEVPHSSQLCTVMHGQLACAVLYSCSVPGVPAAGCGLAVVGMIMHGEVLQHWTAMSQMSKWKSTCTSDIEVEVHMTLRGLQDESFGRLVFPHGKGTFKPRVSWACRAASQCIVQYALMYVTASSCASVSEALTLAHQASH